ncbi:DUF3180 domain-containing protein [Cryobacterium sp. PH31-AA6]|uniref:DUF3180 domain-containing protein n=1 Tax=Cryobacterium sp. PH31-AA6 TaxID=3046205 RepID=UPI0024BA351C|nr:DUF3180 domain-containing protein [Cryobacterium sp. PH31-AA6]MDJ0323759.1 DUF3180 domain-containing protein [Cryobacterium sp. PH31-AA6]
MKRSQPGIVVLLLLVGLVVGFLVEVTAAATGSPIVILPITLPIALVVIGVAVVVLAWPIRQATHGKPGRRVDPFMAIRVAVLAKASAFSGALILGGGIGILVYVLTRSVLPAVPSIWLAIGMALGAALLLVGGLVAEHFCTLPPDDDDENERGEVRA